MRLLHGMRYFRWYYSPFYTEVKRSFKAFTGKNNACANLSIFTLFGFNNDNIYKYNNNSKNTKLIKLHRELRKYDYKDINNISFYEKLVDTLINTDLQNLDMEAKSTYLDLLLLSTEFCANHSDLSTNNLISKLTQIYSTNGRYILNTFGQINESKNIIAKLKNPKEWNLTYDNIFDSIIKLIFVIKRRFSNKDLNLYEQALLLEINRRRLYNLYISSVSNNLSICNNNELNISFLGKWAGNFIFLIVLNVIYALNYIRINKFLDYFTQYTDFCDKEVDRPIKEEVEIKSVEESLAIEKQIVDLAYFKEIDQTRFYSDRSYSGITTTFQLDESRSSRPNSDARRSLPEKFKDPIWPELRR